MLLHSEPVSIAYAASAATVREALRVAGAEWRESKLSASARAAHILGWKVRVRNGRLVVRARISGQNSFLPHFVGQLRDVPTGSVLEGELRLSWIPRLFTLIWFALIGGAPVIALVEPIPSAGIGEHIFAALFMIVPAIALFSFGLWLVRRSWRAPAAAFREFLLHAGQEAATVTHGEPSSEVSNTPSTRPRESSG